MKEERLEVMTLDDDLPLETRVDVDSAEVGDQPHHTHHLLLERLLRLAFARPLPFTALGKPRPTSFMGLV